MASSSVINSPDTLNHIDTVLNNCIHCGMCLPVCPTYNMNFQEQSSPRGRIRLMRSLYEGNLELSDTFVDEMYFCLDCQACQTACPAGVQYGTLVEDARKVIAEQKREPRALRFMKNIILHGILSTPARTKFAAKILRLYQRSGVQEAVDKSEILGLFSKKLQAKHTMLPVVAKDFFDESVSEIIPAIGSRRGRVALLSGCIMNVTLSNIHHDVVHVLVNNGFEVVIPKLQVCCGALHAHYGEVESAKALAKKNIDVFEKFELDALIVDSAGCSAFLKEYGHVLTDDEAYSTKAAALALKTKDVTEFLAEVGFIIPQQGVNKRVTYHEACHLVHTQKISQQPRQIIKSIPELEIVELPEATWCCGSAGMYNAVRFDDSMTLLERKMKNLQSTNADIVLTANPGCHLQLLYGIKKFGLKTEVMHPVSLLRASYKAE